MLSFGVCHADNPVLKRVHGDFTHPIPNAFLPSQTKIWEGLSELRFRSTFHGREYRIWATQR